MRFTLITLLIINILTVAHARLIMSPSLRDMQYSADMVVIARPISSMTTNYDENATDLGHGADVLDVLTKFEVLAVFKGDGHMKTFILHHFCFVRGKKAGVTGPHLVTFDPKSEARYLLYLTQESTNQYAPFTGQWDPGISCIMKLADAGAD